MEQITQDIFKIIEENDLSCLLVLTDKKKVSCAMRAEEETILPMALTQLLEKGDNISEACYSVLVNGLLNYLKHNVERRKGILKVLTEMDKLHTINPN